MAERRTTQRNVALHATDRHFFVAVKPPFEEDVSAYDHLGFMSEEVRCLDEGSQIFVFDREGFGMSSRQQEQRLTEFVYEAIKPLGIIPDVEIHLINVRSEGGHG